MENGQVLEEGTPATHLQRAATARARASSCSGWSMRRHVLLAVRRNDALYPPPYVVSAAAKAREVIGRMVSGAAASAFQASQQASTIAS